MQNAAASVPVVLLVLPVRPGFHRHTLAVILHVQGDRGTALAHRAKPDFHRCKVGFGDDREALEAKLIRGRLERVTDTGRVFQVFRNRLRGQAGGLGRAGAATATCGQQQNERCVNYDWPVA